MLVRRPMAASAVRTPKPWPEMFRALRHRNFRLFWVGQLISLIGSWMQAMAQQWLVYTLTGSALAMGTIFAASSLPVLLVAPFAGVLVDRRNKRNVLLISQGVAMLLAITLAALTFSGVVAYWHVVLLALGNGIVNAIDMPARQAFTSEMVDDKADLTNAIALNSMIFNGARVIGPALAGVLVSLVGLAWAFTLNSVSFIAVLASLLMMQALPQRARNSNGASPLSELAEGFWYAVKTPVISTILLLVLVPSIFGFAYVTLLPIFADQILVVSSGPLASGSARLGALMMSSGAGALAGALTLAKIGKDGDRRRILLRGGLGFGLAICLHALNSSFWLAIPILMAIGFCMIMFLAMANTILQTTAADRLRGRVMSFYVMVLVGLGLVGSLQAGFVAEHWGAQAATGLGAGACILATLLAFRSKALKSLA